MKFQLKEDEAKLYGRSRRCVRVVAEGLAAGAPCRIAGKTCKSGDYLDVDTGEIVTAEEMKAHWQPLDDAGVLEGEVI